MAFDGGAVIARYILDDSGFKAGAKGVQSSGKGMAGAMLKANIAFAALEKGVQLASKAIGDSIKKFVEQERVEKQLETTLKSTKNAVGLTAREIKNMASALQAQTRFGDEAILGAQNMLLTFTKIGKDVFPEATETVLNMSQALGQDLKASSIQLGKALQDPVQGVTALRRVGIQLSDEQTEQIKKFVELGDVASAQKVILGELETQFGGSAKAARDTFGGALDAVQNSMGDLQEDIGLFASILGRDIAENALKAVEGIREFLKSEEGIERISNIIAGLGAAFEVFKEIITPLVDTIKNVFLGVVENLQENFDKLGAKVGGNINVFDILAGAAKTLSIALGVVGGIINLAIDAFFDLIIAAKESAEVVGEVFKFLSGEGSLEGIAKSFGQAEDAFVEFGMNVVDNAAKIVTDVTAEFDDLGSEIGGRANALENIWDKSWKENKTKAEEALKGVNDASEETKDNIQSDIDETQKTWKERWKDMFEAAKANSDKIKKQVKKIKEVFDAVAGEISKVFSGVQDIIGMVFDNQLTELEIKLQKQLAMIEETQQAELEQNQTFFDTRQEQLAIQREQGLISQEEFDEQTALLLAQKKDKDKAIEEKAQADKEAREAAALKKENEIKKKQFIAEKAFKIANVWMDFATAVMGFWAAYASIPIAGPIIAGVLTGVAAGIAGAQTALIAQQSFVPAMATGGRVGSRTGNASTVMINEQGGEIVTLPDGSQVVPNDISRQIATASASASRNKIDINFGNVNVRSNKDIDLIAMKVSRALGRQLRGKE
jgi:hypothetical protein